MSRPGERLADRIPRFPRVSGDEPTIKTDDGNDLVFSPRERG